MMEFAGFFLRLLVWRSSLKRVLTSWVAQRSTSQRNSSTWLNWWVLQQEDETSTWAWGIKVVKFNEWIYKGLIYFGVFLWWWQIWHSGTTLCFNRSEINQEKESTCISFPFCAGWRMERRESVSAAAVLLSGRADAGREQTTAAERHRSSEWKTDSAGQTGLWAFPSSLHSDLRC